MQFEKWPARAGARPVILAFAALALVAAAVPADVAALHTDWIDEQAYGCRFHSTERAQEAKGAYLR